MTVIGGGKSGPVRSGAGGCCCDSTGSTLISGGSGGLCTLKDRPGSVTGFSGLTGKMAGLTSGCTVLGTVATGAAARVAMGEVTVGVAGGVMVSVEGSGEAMTATGSATGNGRGFSTVMACRLATSSCNEQQHTILVIYGEYWQTDRSGYTVPSIP